jgi:hypothetical protein
LAVRRGHVTVIDALAECGADFNKPSDDGRVPLFWATFDKRYPDRVGVVRALLSHPDIDVGSTSARVKNVTPLMNAITRLRNPEVISMLVDSKASTSAQNDQKESAMMLAEKSMDQRIARAILPSDKRNAPSPETVSRIVETVTFVLSWVNNPNRTFGGLVQGAVQSLLGLGGERDEEARQEVEEVCFSHHQTSADMC